MELYPRLALLTDAEAEWCLNGILKGLTATQPVYAELLASPQEMTMVVEAVASDIGKPLPNIGEVSSQERPKAIRVILTEIAEDPELSPRLEAWLKNARPKLLEPVTTTLVLAGVVFLLSTHIDIEYEDQDGKRKLKIKVEKPTSSEKLLEKFFDFFR